MQRDTSGLTSENSDLNMHVQTMEQQVWLQDDNIFFTYFEIKDYATLNGYNLMHGATL
jgi:hypothetical protein